MSSTDQQNKLKQRKAFLKGTLQNIEWAFQLLAIYTIPILFVSSVVLGMQVSGYIDKSGSVGAVICWLAGAALMTAIELSMLGSFGLAATEMKNGQKWRGVLLFIMGFAFIVITIVTLSFSKDNASGDADNILSIVRLSAAVLYAVLAHGVTTEVDDEDLVLTPDLYEELAQKIQRIEDRSNQVNQQIGVVHSALPQVVQSQVQEVVQSLIPSLVQQVVQSQTEIIISEIQGVVHPQLQQAVHLIPETVQEQVQILMAEQMQPLFQVLEEGNSSTALQELAERLQEVSSTVSEMRTTITEVRTVRQVSEPHVRTHRASSKVIDTEPAKGVQSPGSRGKNEPPTELLDEPVGVRVERFILEQIELGNTPSLNQIMNQCKCSKNTAIQYRRKLLPDPENEEGGSEAPELIIDTDSELVALNSR